jgi:undecaprenyl diphosphate synthase
MDKTKIDKLPAHVAIIMDGNGRWAKQKKLKRVEGHRIGMESVREIVTATCELKIPYLTLYAFSKENWARPEDEVTTLMTLLSVYLEKELPLMLDKGIRLNIVGEIEDFPKKLRHQMADVIQKTVHNKNLHLNLALSYSGRREIVHAVKAIVKDAKQGIIKRIDGKSLYKIPLRKRHPGPRSAHQNKRRNEAQQFSLVAGCLYRNICDRDALA